MRRFLPLVLSLLLATPAAANTVSVGGLTFTDDYGGFNLVSVTGSGTREDPFVIVEEVGTAGNAVLAIEGWRTNYYSGEHGGASFWVQKVVINATDKQWGTYELELREQLNLPSGYLDGLSFGQPLSTSRPAASDLLPEVVVRDEPLDAMIFSGGGVEPGEQVAFEFIVTDMTPVDRIFLIQRLRLDISAYPTRRATR
ncbi:MAG TPA: hypothetical protein VJL84_04490 [Kiloniellales bacterium]|nr:hypothetical protein [Kiloniellales bacterium]